MTKNTRTSRVSWLYWQNNVSFHHFTQIRCIPKQILIVQRFSYVELGLAVYWRSEKYRSIRPLFLGFRFFDVSWLCCFGFGRKLQYATSIRNVCRMKSAKTPLNYPLHGLRVSKLLQLISLSRTQVFLWVTSNNQRLDEGLSIPKTVHRCY